MFKVMGKVSALKSTPRAARLWLLDEVRAYGQQRLLEQRELAAQGDLLAAERVQVIERALDLLNSLDV